MTLTVEQLAEIERTLSEPDRGDAVFMVLRQRFAHLSWTRCDASDVVETPFLTSRDFDIHLIDSRDHCAQITLDPACATGVILAKRSVAQ